VGDSIEMFMIDMINSEYKDNSGHILAGADQIVLSGVLLLTAAILM
jgi:hypothetical protein